MRTVVLGTIWTMVFLSSAHWASDIYLLIRRCIDSPKLVSQELRAADNVITALSMINVSDGLYSLRSVTHVRIGPTDCHS